MTQSDGHRMSFPIFVLGTLLLLGSGIALLGMLGALVMKWGPAVAWCWKSSLGFFLGGVCVLVFWTILNWGLLKKN